jgi:hypothetical protein
MRFVNEATPDSTRRERTHEGREDGQDREDHLDVFAAPAPFASSVVVTSTRRA